MKILYIYKDYMKRRKRYGEMMESCGSSVKYLEVKDKHKKNNIFFNCIKDKPDAIWFQNAAYIKNNINFVDYAKSLNIKIISYYTFDPQESYADFQWMEVWKRIDYFFVHNKDFYEFLKENGIISYYMPLGFYPDQYCKTIENKIYDISFCGTDLSRESKKEDKRAEYVRSLREFGIIVYGKGFKDKVGDIPVFSYKTHEIQRKVYGQSKINLDLPFFNTPHKFYKKGNKRYHIKNRFFEIPATGNFLLTIRCQEFLEIFGEDTIGYYDDNIESLKESVKKYLKDDKLRKKMSEKAYKLVHEKHTYLHRFKEMFKIIESNG